MSLTQIRSLPAERLAQDDWLEIGGCMLRIKEIIQMDDRLNISLYNPIDSRVCCYLAVAKNQPMKVYNQT